MDSYVARVDTTAGSLEFLEPAAVSLRITWLY